MKRAGRSGNVGGENAAHGVAMVFLAMAFAFSIVLPFRVIRHLGTGKAPPFELPVLLDVGPKRASAAAVTEAIFRPPRVKTGRAQPRPPSEAKSEKAKTRAEEQCTKSPSRP